MDLVSEHLDGSFCCAKLHLSVVDNTKLIISFVDLIPYITVHLLPLTTPHICPPKYLIIKCLLFF